LNKCGKKGGIQPKGKKYNILKGVFFWWFFIHHLYFYLKILKLKNTTFNVVYFP